jgi:6-phosphogluconolactonase
MKITATNLKVFTCVNLLANELAQTFIHLAQTCIEKQGTFHAALSGGETPLPFFLALKDQHANNSAWLNTHIYFCDERFVPSTDVNNNFRQAYETLLKYVPIPFKQIHAIPTYLDSPQQSAKNYETSIVKNLLDHTSEIKLDCALLGLGIDGHVASLFPATDFFSTEDEYVKEFYVPSLESWRISLSLSMINRTKNIFFLITSKKKADIFNKLRSCDLSLPGSHINGNVTYYLDEAVLDRSLIQNR